MDKGLQVTEAVMYDTVPAKNEDSELLNALKNQQIDIITFTSSSTVKYFLQALSNMGLKNPIEAIQGVTIACIGPVTAQTAQEVGLNVTLVSKEATLDSLLEVIRN
ncbi:uroporphyrinogen-III synthase [compost metagenome]